MFGVLASSTKIHSNFDWLNDQSVVSQQHFKRVTLFMKSTNGLNSDLRFQFIDLGLIEAKKQPVFGVFSKHCCITAHSASSSASASLGMLTKMGLVVHTAGE